MFLIGRMTITAFGFEVGTFCLEVSKSVIEIVFDKNNNIRIPAFVVGMA